MKELNLTRPICFLDIEATGIDRENDRIVELCVAKYHPDGNLEVKTKRFYPGIPIPAEATEVHGISDGDVVGCIKFAQVAKDLLAFITGCDIAGFNSNNYDIPMLYFEFNRAGVNWEYWNHKFIDVGNIFKIQEPRTLEAAVKFYNGQEHKDAHGAEPDTLATLDVFITQLRKYPDLPKTVDELALFSNYGNELLDISGKFIKGKDGEILFNFGKHRGQPAKNHPDFLEWMLWKADFAPDTCRIAQQVYEGK